jgi:CxxC motif-containing protein
MTNVQYITCISCPMGCRMKVTLKNAQVTLVENNSCKRGEIYACQECTQPQRMITAVVRVEGSTVPVSVKTKSSIPKDKIQTCMYAINSLRITPPILSGQVLLDDIADTGVSLVATRTIT